MPHDTTLIVTLAIGLGGAFVLGLAAKRLGLPPLVGYLAAGIVAGPFTPGFTADAGLASQLAEVGVILLMFGVGIHFSIDQLLAVRRTAVPGALLRIGLVGALGVPLAAWWGWTPLAGLIFGTTLAVASTVVLLRTLEERNAVDTVEGRLAVGWLIVEDLAMVLVLVLLPALASPQGVGPVGVASADLWTALAVTLGKVGLFIVLMIVVGRRAVPWLLERVAKEGSRELFTLAVLAIAIVFAVGSAAIFGVSFALGAFFAGVMISESDLSHQAASDALPLQDAFAVLFFFSVGMLVDPASILAAPGKLAVTLAVVLVLRYAIVAGFLLWQRQPLRRALLVAAGLAQIGEFSFILAALAVALDVLPREAEQLMLAASLISITVNPLVVGGTRRLDNWIHRRPRLHDALERVEASDPLRALPDGPDAPHRDHVVLVGHGRVGSVVAYALSQAEIPYVVIEQDRALVERLRTEGVAAIYGDATRALVREQAGCATARLLIVTTPDPYQARHIVKKAREERPDLQTVVRTHSKEERRFLKQQDVGRVVMGEEELAYGIAHFSLMAMGRSDDEADERIAELRAIE
jgi:CPA2 family monovalent cation:H+ antiporter-2